MATMRMWPNRQTRAPTMLSLESPEWANLHHAYGPASDIPRLLRQLDTLPLASGNAEPWFSIWSALAHQGDVLYCFVRGHPTRGSSSCYRTGNGVVLLFSISCLGRDLSTAAQSLRARRFGARLL